MPAVAARGRVDAGSGRGSHQFGAEFRRPAGVPRRHLLRRARRSVRHPRALGLRQIHAVADADRPADPQRGAGAGLGARRPHRVGADPTADRRAVSIRSAVWVVESAGERNAASADPDRPAARRLHRHRPDEAGAGGLGRRHCPSPGGDLGRHGQTGRHRPCSSARPTVAVPGRALRRARPGDLRRAGQTDPATARHAGGDLRGGHPRGAVHHGDRRPLPDARPGRPGDGRDRQSPRTGAR